MEEIIIQTEEKKKVNIARVLALVAGFLAIFFSLVMAGARIADSIETVSVTKKVSLIGVIFGCSKTVYTTANGIKLIIPFKGGLSALGFISFLSLIASIVLLFISIKKPDKKFEIVGYGLMLLAGILIFLSLVAGSNVSVNMADFSMDVMTYNFTDFYEGFHLAVGVYFYGVLCILASGFGIYKYIMKVIKK